MIAPVFLTVCGTKKNEGCLITRNRDKSEHFISLDHLKSKENPKLTYLAEKAGFVICTNEDWWKIPDLKDSDKDYSDSYSRTVAAIKK